MTGRFWQDDPDAPFATLLWMAEAHCHPEADDDAYDALKRLVRRQDDPDVIRFKEELTAAIRDPGQVPEDALYDAAQFSDGSDEKFLARLWRDLYPGESLPSD